MATKQIAKRKKQMKSRSRVRATRSTRRRRTMRCRGRARCFLGGSYLPKDATITQYDGIPVKKNALITSSAGVASYTGTRKELMNHAEYEDFQGGQGDGTD
jgi:hypothetical protein